MKRLLAAVLLLLAAQAMASDVPFFIRTLEGPKDTNAINENFRSLVNDITKIRADVDTPASDLAAGDSPSLSGINVFTSTAPFNTLFQSAVAAGALTVTIISVADPQKPCITGSTVTLACYGGFIEVWYSGWFTGQTSAIPTFGYLRDGVDVGRSFRVNSYAGSSHNGSWRITAANPGVGVHTYCMWANINTGTVTVPDTVSAPSGPEFGVRCWP